MQAPVLFRERHGRAVVKTFVCRVTQYDREWLERRKVVEFDRASEARAGRVRVWGMQAGDPAALGLR